MLQHRYIVQLRYRKMRCLLRAVKWKENRLHRYNAIIQTKWVGPILSSSKLCRKVYDNALTSLKSQNYLEFWKHGHFFTISRNQNHSRSV